ncbi:hypothetical protein [Bradyrhizobium sp. AUGA SZCCT0160]|uniref:hypothetical protein n=1 Tax=Bradyrhizobium sp. AUGA SZCCT0160 TaxID=2807662 RepID=UPI001BA98C84|nr:hypothetical protein [Bradyrhizobium sp. AUGA SZCCT0160]MBR1193231.1 hypothetical protein [Bradyrhizobium sp. AUGA SZCCT0160]
MADKMKFKVLRRHEGDRMYEEGDTREGTQAELGHLVPKVLELLGPADRPLDPAKPAEPVKAEPAPLNKSEPAPANKAEPVPSTSKTHHPRNKRK